MELIFTRKFFANNRQKLKKSFDGTAPIVMSANGLLQRGGDSTYAFSQDASFWYLTGINDPDIILVMDKDKEYLIVPSRSTSRETFDGVITTKELSDRSGIKTVYDETEGWELLGSRLKKSKHVATINASATYIASYGFYTNPARTSFITKMKDYKPDLEIIDIGGNIVSLRIIKQPEELKAIQKAIDITSHALKELSSPNKLSTYKYEYQVEAELTKAIRANGADDHAFSPIIASGNRACVLHNVGNSGKLATDDLLLMDCGAEIDHYAADITRTISLKKASARQQAVFKAVKEVRQFAESLLKPGILIRDYEIEVENYMGEKLRQLSLIKQATHENIRQYFPHATSHFLGLNVHDVGDYSQPLKAGMVLTIEPGIYIKEEGIGVRLEDDALITEKGIKVLSDHLPLELELN